MSNKTRLQTNNINLQNLITKANNLPDAGSGGGSVETCTLILNGEGPGFSDAAIYYLNSSNALIADTFPNFNESKTYTILKNSIIVFYGLKPMNYGELTILVSEGPTAACYISKDISIGVG
jgi:hypothetical protein